MRGGDLSQAVAHHDAGRDAHARPQGHQRALQRVDGGLGPRRVVQQAVGAAPPEHHVEQRGLALAGKLGCAAVEDRPEHGLGLVQRLAHACPLAGLTGEGEGRLGRTARCPAAVDAASASQFFELGPQLGGVAEDDPGPVIEVAPARRGRPRHVRERRAGRGRRRRKLGAVLVEPAQIGSGRVLHSLRRPARQRQQASLPRRRRRGAYWGICGGICRPIDVGTFGGRSGARSHLAGRARRGGQGAVRSTCIWRAVARHHDVGIRAGPAEGVHARDRRLVAVCRPIGHVIGDAHRQPVPVHLRARAPEIQMARDSAVPHHQHRLDEPRSTRCRSQMPDVGLHRAHQHGALRAATAPIDRCRGGQLDRIADDRPCAVSFQVVGVAGSDAGAAQRLEHGPFLRGAAGHGQALTGAVLIHRRASEDCPDAVAGGLGVAEALEHHQAAALPADEAVGGLVEGPALTSGRQHSRTGAQLKRTTGQEDVDSSGQRQVGLAPLQRRGCLMDGHQRRRAGRVDGHRGPFEAERERDSADRGVQRSPRHRIEAGGGIDRLGGVDDHVPIVGVADACIDPCAAASQAGRVDGRVFEGLPARVEHQALLRVEHLGFERGDAEELCVELVQVVNERAVAQCLAALFRFGIEASGTPDDRAGRTLGDRVLAGHELSPELGDASAAGEPAGHPDNGHRFLRWEFAVFHDLHLHRGLTSAAVTAASRC